MSNCCYDPTGPHKIDPRELIREQERYGNLIRDLFTGDPEKILLRLLPDENAYLRELAALRAHYPSVRCRAIELLDARSLSVLEKIAASEPDSQFGQAARNRIERLA